MEKIKSKYETVAGQIEKYKIYDWALIFFSICMVVIYAIRCNDYVFNPDSCYTAKLSTWTWKDIIVEAAADVHPPLYYFMASIVYKMFGWGAPWYHLLSLSAYVIEIIVLNIYVKKKIGVLPTFVATLLISMIPASLSINLLARMYSWAALFVFLFYLTVYEIICGDDKLANWICLVVFALLTAYTHYYAFMHMALIYLGLLLFSILVNRNILKKVILSIVAAIIGYMPWIIVSLQSAMKVIKYSNDDYWLKKMPTTLGDCLRSYFGWNVIVILALVLYVVALIKFIKEIGQKKKTNNKDLWLIIGAISAVLAIAVPELISIFAGNMLVTRYLFPMMPVAVLVFACLLTQYDYRYVWGGIVSVLILSLGINATVNSYNSDRGANSRHREFMNAVGVDENDFLVGDQYAFTWSIFGYYYPNNLCCGLEDWLDNYEPTTSEFSPEQHLMFFDNGMQEYIVEAMDKKGLTAEFVYSGQFGAMDEVDVYRIKGK